MKPSGLIAGPKPPPDIIIAQLVDNQQVALLFYINADFQNASTLLEISLPSAWKARFHALGNHTSTRLEVTLPRAWKACFHGLEDSSTLWNAQFHALGTHSSTGLERRVPHAWSAGFHAPGTQSSGHVQESWNSRPGTFILCIGKFRTPVLTDIKPCYTSVARLLP